MFASAAVFFGKKEIKKVVISEVLLLLFPLQRNILELRLPCVVVMFHDVSLREPTHTFTYVFKDWVSYLPSGFYEKNTLENSPGSPKNHPNFSGKSSSEAPPMTFGVQNVRFLGE